MTLHCCCVWMKWEAVFSSWGFVAIFPKSSSKQYKAYCIIFDRLISKASNLSTCCTQSSTCLSSVIRLIWFVHIFLASKRPFSIFFFFFAKLCRTLGRAITIIVIRLRKYWFMLFSVMLDDNMTPTSCKNFNQLYVWHSIWYNMGPIQSY